MFNLNRPILFTYDYGNITYPFNCRLIVVRVTHHNDDKLLASSKYNVTSITSI